MILKSLTVRHWGCLIGGVHLAGFVEGINIIHGPNESGKSTIVDALTRGLFDRHKMQSAELRAKQPWGTALSPEVVIEFEHGNRQYRVKKCFISSQRCELQHKIDGNWEPLADGDSADERLLELLESERPGSGATQPKHRGIAQLLWFPQGQVWFPEDGINKKSKDRLRSVLDGILITPEFHSVENRVQNLYAELFTPVTAKLNAGSEPNRLEKEFTEARETLDEIKQRWESLDKLNMEILDLQTEYDESKTLLEQEKPKLEKAIEALKEAQKRASDRKLIEAEVRAKEALWKAINKQVREIDEVRQKLNTLRNQGRSQDELYWGLESEVQKAKEIVSKVEGFLNEIREQRDEAQINVNSAQARVDLARNRIDIKSLSNTLEQLGALSQRYESLKTQLQNLQTPSDNEIKELRRLHEAIRETRTRLEASALQIRFQPYMKVVGSVTKDGKGEQFDFIPGKDEALEWQAAQLFELDIQGTGYLSVSSGSGEVRNLKADLDKKEQIFRLAIAPFGGASLSELDDRKAQADILKEEMKGINFQEKALAPKGVEVLKRRLGNLEAQRDQILEEYPELIDDESSEENADAAQKGAKQNLATVSNELQKVEKQLKEAQKALQEMKDNQGKVKENLTKIRTNIELLEDQEKDLIKDGLTDAQRQEQLIKALDELDQAKQRLELIPPVENLKELEIVEKRCQEAVERLEKKLRDIENNLNQKTGALRHAEGEGLYSKLAEAEERAALLENMYSSALTRAKSIKLLRDILNDCRQEALEDVFAPVNQLVSQSFRRIVGGQYEEVNLSDDFLPDTITVPARDARVKPELLSYGTREQLNILARVTLGRILAESERQLVVLDDPLAHTDLERHNMMLEFLHEAAESLQLVILTCHPAVYSGLGAQIFDLEELKSIYKTLSF